MWKASYDVLSGTAKHEDLAAALAWAKDNAKRLEGTYSASLDYRLAAGYLAARAGDKAILEDALSTFANVANLRDYPLSWQAHEVLLAERDRLAGRTSDAIARLTPIAARTDGLAIVHSALARSLAAEKRYTEARTQAGWLSSHRGRVFVERGLSGFVDPINFADTTLAWIDIAEWSKAMGDDEAKANALRQLHKAWETEGLPTHLRRRIESI
jgi:hypothetical protein